MGNEKSQSQRLRNVLYRLWEKDFQSSYKSDDFIREYMEKVIDQVKDKLN